MLKSNKGLFKLTISAMCIALYCVIMYLTQSFSFGAIQMRVATAMYGLGYLFPFLIIPMGIANFLSNLLGGMGAIDMIGGCVVGMLATGGCVLIRRLKWNRWICIVPIVVFPSFIVSLWLSPITGVPYLALVGSLALGQAVPAVLGVILAEVLGKISVTNGYGIKAQE